MFKGKVTGHKGTTQRDRTSKWADECHTSHHFPKAPSCHYFPHFSYCLFIDWLGNIATINSIRPCMHAKSLQSCPTLCNPMDRSPSGSSVPGIFQARILEWVAVPSSRGSSRLRDRTRISYISCIGRWALLPLVLPEKLWVSLVGAQ